MLTVEIIRSEAEFAALKPEWNDLLEQSGQSSPFLSHEWFSCCLEGFSQGRELYIHAVRERGTLLGIAPLWLYDEASRWIPARQIGFITSLDTPFADFILQKERQQEILIRLLDQLLTKSPVRWDLISLRQWPSVSPRYGLAEQIFQRQRRSTFREVASTVPYIPIEGSWEAFLEGRSVKFRKTHRNIVNRVAKLKNVQMLCYRQDAGGEVLRDVLTVSEKSWKKVEGIAISSKEESKRFFRALTRAASERDWLMVWVLKVEGTPVATEYHLVDDRTVYALRADFDEAHKSSSPGAYLEYQIVKQLFEEGYREYNTGPGLNTYKLHWTEHRRENVTINVCNNSLRGRAIWGAEKVWPLLRQVKSLKGQWVSKNAMSEGDRRENR